MNLSDFLFSTTVLVVSFCLLVQSKASAPACGTPVVAKRPHIIMVIVDDMGWNDVSYHGSTQIPTPNLDALAADGVVLNNYYVSPLCTPSRGTLMTGMHAIHTGLQHYVIVGGEPWGLPLNFTTLPQRLKAKGYSTHAVGKWHLGFHKKEYTPTFRGFDSHFGYWGGKEDYYDHTNLERSFWGLDFHDNHNCVTNATGQYATDIFTDRAIDIIRQHDTSQPLFLYLCHLAVHSANSYDTLQAPPEYLERFSHIEDWDRRRYAGMMSAFDDSVGRLFASLEKAKMLDNTILVFSNDNGGPPAGFDDNAASNWPLRGTKLSLWEGGVRGTALVWSPLLKKRRRVSNHMMHISDWMPTLYRAAGGNVEDLGELDGMDLWSSISQDTPSPRQEVLHNIDPVYNMAGVRIGDYKLLFGAHPYGDKWDDWFGPSGRGNVTLEHDSVTRDILNRYWNETIPIMDPVEVKCGERPVNASRCIPGDAPCLFNIAEDPCEFNNLAQDHPDILSELWKRVLQHNSTAVPPGNKPIDPNSNPALHNYAWINWLDYM